jgi:hypothetical protein
MIELYKDGDRMAILTDAPDEDTFIRDMATVFGGLIEHGSFDYDWEFQFGYWLPAIVDICCKYRGYKNNVAERRVLCSGASGFPTDFKVCSFRNDKLEILWSAPPVDEVAP